MPINDPIADMLVRIRNAANARHESVALPHSKLKEEIASIMVNEGFLKSFDVVGEGWKKALVIGLTYTADRKPVIHKMKRESKLGRRLYIRAGDIKANRQGVGVAILSTSKGVFKDIDAKRHGVGGEVILTVW